MAIRLTRMDAEIGIIGGSGFYTFLSNPERVEVDTPFGTPSAPLTVGEVAGRKVAFLPRHGVNHEYPPHKVNYRANLWALRSLGVRQVIAPAAVGSGTSGACTVLSDMRISARLPLAVVTMTVRLASA